MTARDPRLAPIDPGRMPTEAQVQASVDALKEQIDRAMSDSPSTETGAARQLTTAEALVLTEIISAIRRIATSDATDLKDVRSQKLASIARLAGHVGDPEESPDYRAALGFQRSDYDAVRLDAYMATQRTDFTAAEALRQDMDDLWAMIIATVRAMEARRWRHVYTEAIVPLETHLRKIADLWDEFPDSFEDAAADWVEGAKALLERFEPGGLDG